MTKPHRHLPTPERAEVLSAKENIKNMALNNNDQPRTIYKQSHLKLTDDCVSGMPNKNAIRQMINRSRKNKAGYGIGAKSLNLVEIPENLKNTYKDNKFYWDDSGSDDLNRVIIFTTSKNIDLLEKHRDW